MTPQPEQGPVTRAERAEVEAVQWREELWAVYLALGNDPDGCPDGRWLNPGEVLRAAQEARNDYDEAIGVARTFRLPSDLEPADTISTGEEGA